jgi:hypothetical protein
VTYGGGKFVAVGNNGIDWTVRASAVNASFLSVSYGHGVFVIVGRNGKILTGPDGGNWISQSSGVRNDLMCVIMYHRYPRYICGFKKEKQARYEL